MQLFLIPIENTFAAFDYQRAQGRARAYGDAAKETCYRFNQPAEYRFVEVQNSSLLQAAAPGKYMVTEMLGFTDSAPGLDSWQKAYAEVECEWTTKYGAVPHLSKLHSFGVDPVDGLMKPGQACMACKWFSDEQKAAFNQARQNYDPHGLFAGSWAEAMLKPCPTDCPAERTCSPKGEPDCSWPWKPSSEQNFV